jgi:ABC-type multidrug transport system ATPase subunit
MPNHAITAENLTYRYGDLVAVDHINFDVAEGEILGFLGPNGAGKTTTVKMLTGRMRPKEGRATLWVWISPNRPKKCRRRSAWLDSWLAAHWTPTPEFTRYANQRTILSVTLSPVQHAEWQWALVSSSSRG